ncbi:HD domain-containing phosphohydrolase [Deltaproteobacteria bacterium TL4]
MNRTLNKSPAMQQLRLVIPHFFRAQQFSKTPASAAVEIIVNYYQNINEIELFPAELPSLIIIDEEDYLQWELPVIGDGVIGVILIEKGSHPFSKHPHPQFIINRIPPNPSQQQWHFTFEQAIQSLQNKIYTKKLKAEVEEQDYELNRLNEIGVALSVEKDLDKLLHLIVIKAMDLVHADAGSLYLIEPTPGVPENPDDYFANKHFRFKVAQNESRNVPFRSFALEISKQSIYGYVALTRKPLIIGDAYYIDEDKEYSWAGAEFDKSIKYRTKSMLTVPMVNHEDVIIGVIQLINFKNKKTEKLGTPEEILGQVGYFTEKHSRAVESIASQAAVALQNARLLESIQILFDGFINASVKAIESRDPTTSGHSSRVATLTVALAETINRIPNGTFKDLFFTQDQLHEIRYASLLHDFGKIGVQEKVLLKSKKLYPEQEQVLMDRFRLMRQSLELKTYKGQIDYFLEKSREEFLAYRQVSSKELQEQLEAFDDYLKFIVRCNEPTVLSQGGFDRLREIAKYEFLHPSHVKIPLITEEELDSLSVPKGSLNSQDRREIESHVTHTYKFLSMIPWTKALSEVPDIAHAHHEKLDGSGYPLGLNAKQIPVQSKMMTISDIYDALAASDRPYKRAMPVDRALKILEYEAKDNHIDRQLLDIFIEAKLFELVTRPM